MLIGVERRGVLSSDDGGGTFVESNDGFFHRQVLALAADPWGGGHLLALLANAPALFLGDRRRWTDVEPASARSGPSRQTFLRHAGWLVGHARKGGFARHDGLKPNAAWGRRKNRELFPRAAGFVGRSRGRGGAGLAARSISW